MFDREQELKRVAFWSQRLKACLEDEVPGDDLEKVVSYLEKLAARLMKHIRENPKDREAIMWLVSLQECLSNLIQELEAD